MFDWEDYLKLSEAWKDADNSEPLSEAYYRSAIREPITAYFIK